MNLKAHINITITIILTLTCKSTYAQQNLDNIALEASECIALYTIMTSIPTSVDPRISTVYEDTGLAFRMLYSHTMTKLHGKPPTNGKIMSQTSVIMEDIGIMYDLNPELVVSLYSLCDGWRIEMASFMRANPPNNIKEIQSIFDQVGGRPINIDLPLTKELKVRGLVDLAIHYWSENGRITINQVKQEILNSFKDKN